MAETPHTTALPNPLPVFPLPGVLLLPRGRLPLNIFEPRYLNMIEDALGHGRIFGMVQPRAAGDEDEPVADAAPLYDIGCAGRITSFAETDDGRILITLLGLTRFRIKAEVAPLGGYRRVTADATGFAADRTPETQPIEGREALLLAAKKLFTARGFELDWKALAGAPDEPLITAFAMIAPLEVAEKQALLETPTLGQRASTLATMIEMAIRQKPGPAAQPN